MRSKRKRCAICRHWFRSHPQTAKIQKVCRNKDCQKERHRQGCIEWHVKNADFDKSRRDKIRAWSKKRGYWRQYRSRHPDYAERERLRMRRRRLRAKGVAKRDAWREIAVVKLESIQRLKPQGVAKRDAWDRRVDELISWLKWRECVAKREAIGVPSALAR